MQATYNLYREDSLSFVLLSTWDWDKGASKILEVSREWWKLVKNMIIPLFLESFFDNMHFAGWIKQLYGVPHNPEEF